MNEQQAQSLAQRIREHLPHVEVFVKRSCELADWIEASYPHDAEDQRPANDDDGTWGCQIVIPREVPTRASTKIARCFCDEADWENYVTTYEPLIHRVVEQAHQRQQTHLWRRRT